MINLNKYKICIFQEYGMYALFIKLLYIILQIDFTIKFIYHKIAKDKVAALFCSRQLQKKA